MNIKDAYIHNGDAILKDIKVENSALKKILAGKKADDTYLGWETVCDLTGIKPTAAVTADKVGHKLTFTGGVTGDWNGSADKTIAIPTKSSWNYDDVYLKLSGGTMANTNVVTNLNADLLDGYHESRFFIVRRGTLGTSSNPISNPPTANELIDATENGSYTVMLSGASGHLLNFNLGHSSTQRAQFYMLYGNNLWFRTSINNDLAQPWKKIAFTDSNVASASKWENARTITLTGSVTGSVSIDGSQNVTLNTTTNHTHTFASLTSKPTTIAGYGITDAYTTSTIDNKLSTYLPLAGGQMNNDAFIAWNKGSEGNDLADWSITDNGLRIISSVSSTSKAPTQYATGLHVKGRYGFQIASQGGSSSNEFFIKNVYNTIWNTLLHSNNYTTYTVKKDGTGASGTWGISITGNATTAAALTTSAGSTNIPIYFTGGKPAAISISTGTMNIERPFVLVTDNNELYKTSGITANYSKNSITATTFKGNLEGNAKTATSLGEGALKYMCSLYATNSYNAYKIVTDWNKSNSAMPTINIRGYDYDSFRTIDCDIVIYHYNNDAIKYSLTNKGSYPIRVWQAIENDVQVFYIQPGSYFGMFNVFVYGGIRTDAFTNWSMTTVDEVSGTEIESKPIATSITGNASTSSKWANARTITLTGSVTGSVSIDGSANVSLATTTNHTHTKSQITDFPTSLPANGGYADAIASKGMLDSQEKIDNFITPNRFEYALFKTNDANNVDFASNDGMLLSIPWNNTAYGVQLAFDDTRYGTVKVRGKSNTWGNWYTLLHSGNYTTYTVKKDGTGASGTWGINITGNAKTATNVDWNGITNKPTSFEPSSHNHSFTLGATTITTGETCTAITGPFAVNTAASADKAFAINRNSAIEGVKHWVDDSTYHIEYTNDETASSIAIRLINTDIERATDKGANATDVTVYLDSYRNFYPNVNNTGSIGQSSYKWANMFATTFHGSLDGKATYASNVGSSGTAGTNYVTATNVISMYNWYNSITATDEASNTAIDKWNEIVSFLAGITDTSTLSGLLAKYLPLTGGTLSGNLQINHNEVDNQYIIYKNNRIKENGGGWADNIIIVKNSSNANVFNFGVYGGNNSLHYTYLGTNSYDGNNLRIYSDKVCFGANTIYHSGNLPAYPTVNNGALYLQANGTTKVTFTANQSSNSTLNIATGSSNGTISVGGTDVAVKGLGSNAYTSTAYLPLAGGTMDNNAQIKRKGRSSAWVYGRDNALIKETSSSGYHPLFSLKTTDGSWELGEYSIPELYNIPIFSYITDTNYNSGNNATTYQIKFPLASGMIALTADLKWSNISSKPETATRWPSWSEVTNKPSTFPVSEHNHDGRYLRWNGSAADVSAMAWGTLTAANGYTILSHAASSDGGDWGMVNKGGKIYMQLDGYYYQNEGQYRVTDVSETVTALGTSGNYLTWTKNGSTSNITVPYASNAESATNANFFVGCNNTITVAGDANTYYPVMISTTTNKKSPNIITVWKDLGSKTASYPGNHSNGSSSMLYRYDIRNCYWDGNGGYCTTLDARYMYARLVSETMMLSNGVGNFCIWLRGGGTEYNINTSWYISPSDINIYYSSTNVGSSTYPVTIAPRTDIGNEGVFNTITIPCDVKYASYAGSVAWDNITEKPSTFTPATHTHTFASLTEKPTTISGYGITDGLRRVTLANNVENDFNTFENLTLTGRGDPTTGSSLLNSPWTTQPAGGFGVLTYLWSGYGLQLAAGYASNDLYIRNKYYTGSGSNWDTHWDKILNSSNFNSYAPKLDGTGATGTWRINVTGSAGSVERATFGDGSNATHDANAMTSNGLYYYSSNGPTINAHNFATNDAAMYVQAYNTSWVSQIAQDYRSGKLAVRSRNNGTWQPWRRIAFADSDYIISADRMYYEPEHRKFTRTAPGNSWDTQAYSVCGYKECRVTYKISQTSAYIMVGLNSDPTTDASYQSIDYCWYTQNGGELCIYENGNYVSSISGHTTYAVGDELIVEYSCGQVRYYHNGVLCRTVARIYGSPLYFDCSFYQAGSIENVVFEPIHDSLEFVQTTASYSLSNAAWTNTITLPTTAGSYILNIVSGNSTLTGVFSIGASDNAKDEISLHLHGNGPRLYARTNGTILQLSSNDASAPSRSVTIKYRRMI